MLSLGEYYAAYCRKTNWEKEHQLLLPQHASFQFSELNLRID